MVKIINTIIRWSLLGCTIVCAVAMFFPSVNNSIIQKEVEMYIGSVFSTVALSLLHILPMIYVAAAGIIGAAWPGSRGTAITFFLSCIAALIMINALFGYSQYGLVLGAGFYIVLFVSIIAVFLSFLQMILYLNNKNRHCGSLYNYL